jgi:hypothetical protein
MDDRMVSGLSFGEAHFGTAQLGDRRRTKRLVELADRMVRHPGETLPIKISHPASLKACYRLMDCEPVTHESVLAPARERTLRRIEGVRETVLLIHDTTELDYTGLTSLDELGQIGNGSHRGYVAHNTLAIVAETREVIGLAYQKLAKRPQARKDETREEMRRRPDRESRLWKKASATLPASSKGQRIVEIADRGADVLEYLDALEVAGKHYVVRSKSNRRIRLKNGEQTKLHDYVRALPAQDSKTIQVPARAGQTARSAQVSISWAPVTLLIPPAPRGEYRGVPLETWVICVREVNPPAGVEGVEWILLTNVPVENSHDAAERIRWYECRWIIEEYHKALKTGCGVQQLQFTTEERLQPAIALLSVIAVSLLKLRDVGRSPDATTHRATDYYSDLEVKVLSLWRYNEPRTDLTVHDFYYALARLGGHQNRKGDHPPGWLVLWRGWTQLQPMIATAEKLGFGKCG